ncbi:MAG: Hpt domain-containing protein [Methylovirgula sp.]
MHPADDVDDPAARHPLDPLHLATQTDGDLPLQRDLLKLFVVQSAELMAALRDANPIAAGDLAHKLSGSARAIGAFELAAAAAKLDGTLPPKARQAALESLAVAFDRALFAVEAYLRKLSPRPEV